MSTLILTNAHLSQIKGGIKKIAIIGHWWNAYILKVESKNGRVVTGTGKWEDKRGAKDKFGELPWHHITLHNECGK